MKNIVKRFGQFINESRFSGNSRFGKDYGIERSSESNQMSLLELLQCWVQTNQPNGTVLAIVDLSGTSEDLADGGIEFIINPSDAEIGVAQHDGSFYCELFKDGKRIIDDEYFVEDGDE